MSNDSRLPRVPDDWLESLQRSKGQITAGESVPLLLVLERLRASAERLEAGMDADGDEAGHEPRR